MSLRRTLLGCTAVVAVVALGACGSSDSSSDSTSNASTTGSSSSRPITIDVGTKKITFPKGTKPKIAFFGGSGNAYQSAQQKQIQSFKDQGVNITYLDSKFDPQTQLKQMQNALTSKQYNAWIVENYGGDTTCQMLSKQAPAANVVVVQQINPTCGKASQPAGDSYWTPGTLATIGGEATVDYYTAFAKSAKGMFGTEKPVVAVLNGPPLVASTVNLNTALKANGIKTVANVGSNYTTPDGLAKTQNMLQAHPDINTIISIYGDSTLGAIQAVKQAGKTGKIKIFDIGGSQQITDGIKAGKQTMSVPYFPVSHSKASVDAILAAFAGKQGPRFEQAFSEGSIDAPFTVTKDTADSYKAEY